MRLEVRDDASGVGGAELRERGRRGEVLFVEREGKDPADRVEASAQLDGLAVVGGDGHAADRRKRSA